MGAYALKKTVICKKCKGRGFRRLSDNKGKRKCRPCGGGGQFIMGYYQRRQGISPVSITPVGPQDPHMLRIQWYLTYELPRTALWRVRSFDQEIDLCRPDKVARP